MAKKQNIPSTAARVVAALEAAADTPSSSSSSPPSSSSSTSKTAKLATSRLHTIRAQAGVKTVSVEQLTPDVAELEAKLALAVAEIERLKRREAQAVIAAGRRAAGQLATTRARHKILTPRHGAGLPFTRWRRRSNATR